MWNLRGVKTLDNLSTSNLDHFKLFLSKLETQTSLSNEPSFSPPIIYILSFYTTEE